MKKLLLSMMLALSLSACGGGGGADYGNAPKTDPEYIQTREQITAIGAKWDACRCDKPLAYPHIITNSDLHVMIKWATYHNNQEQINLYKSTLERRAAQQVTTSAQQTTSVEPATEIKQGG